mgnify:FL=1
MNYFLSFNEIVPNLFLLLNRYDKVNSISIDNINKYGSEIVNFLESNGYKVLLVLNRKLLNQFIFNNKNYFRLINKDDKVALALNNGFPIEELNMINKRLPNDILFLMNNEEIINKIFKSNQKVLEKSRF